MAWVVGRGTLGRAPLRPRLAVRGFETQALALGCDAGREFGDELPGSGAPDQASEVGDGAAYTLALQPPGQFVEQHLGMGAGGLGFAQQPQDRGVISERQTLREDERGTTT